MGEAERTGGLPATAETQRRASDFLSGAVELPPPWTERQYTLFGEVLNWQFGPRQLLGLGVVVLFTGINLAGVAFGGRVQTFLTSLKVLAVAGVIVGSVYVVYARGYREDVKSEKDQIDDPLCETSNPPPGCPASRVARLAASTSRDARGLDRGRWTEPG